MRRRTTVIIVVALGLASLAGPLAIVLGAERGQASFGDSETMGVNQLSSATVAVAVGPNTVPISATLLAPGDRTSGSVELRNQGTLPLRYAIRADRSGASMRLLDVLLWEIWMSPNDSRCVRGAVQPLLFSGPLQSDALIGDASVGQDAGDLVLDPDGTDLLCMEAALPIDVTDEFQDLAATVDLVILAEQAVGEP